MGVSGHLRTIRAILSMELATAMAYRTNFILQSLGMILNDLFFLGFWYLIFARFQSINGWDYRHMVLLFGIVAGGFGLSNGFFGNYRRLSLLIENGELDYYLTLPKNVLSHCIVRLGYAGLGDLMLGVVLGMLILPDWRWLLYLCYLVSAALVMIGWGLTFNSLTFFFGRFEDAARGLTDMLTLFGTYPFSVYTGLTRVVLTFAIPVGLMAGIPVETLFSLDPLRIALVFGGSLMMLGLGVGTFFLGLRRYTSGNMMAMRG